MQSTPKPHATELTQGLAGFDARSLREGAAALALWPPNADRHVALSELINALAGLPCRAGGAEMKATDWRRWLESEDSVALRSVHPGGFHDAPLALATTIDGQRRGLIAGRLEFPAVHYQLWVEALMGLDDRRLDMARRCLVGTAELCDDVLVVADIASARWPDHKLEGQIEVPDDQTFERLRGALAPRALSGSFGIEPLFEEALPLRRFCPLASPGKSPFVSDPWQLSLSGLVRASELAGRAPATSLLRERLSDGALAVARSAAEQMCWTIEAADDDRLVARADLDCFVMLGVWVLPPGLAPGAPEIEASKAFTEYYESFAESARGKGVQHSVLTVLGDGRPLTLEPGHPALRAADGDPWLLGIGELEALGDALRLDPLGLPTALERIPRPPWPENFDLLDFVGVVRRATATAHEQKEVPEDGTELMLLLGGQMTGRHPAPRRDRAGWCEVTRWSGSADHAIYRDNSDKLALLVRSPNRFVWVDCDLKWADRHALLGGIVTMAAFWFARLCEAGWLALAAASAGELAARFHFEIDRRIGPALVAVGAGDQARLVAGPGFIHSLCRGDNEADRMLAAAALQLTESVWAGTAGRLLEEVVPIGRATFLIWPWPECDSNPPALEPPPRVTRRDRREMQREVAASFVKPGQILVVSEEERLPAIIKDLLTVLEERIGTVADLQGVDAVRDLIALHERAAWQYTSEAVGLPARSAFGAAAEALGEPEAVGARNLVLRNLIERLSAGPRRAPGGLSLRAGGWLRAAGELQLELMGTREAVLSGVSTAKVVVSQEYGIAIVPQGNLRLADVPHHVPNAMK